jgi:hypothetical protein
VFTKSSNVEDAVPLVDGVSQTNTIGDNCLGANESGEVKRVREMRIEWTLSATHVANKKARLLQLTWSVSPIVKLGVCQMTRADTPPLGTGKDRVRVEIGRTFTILYQHG